MTALKGIPDSGERSREIPHWVKLQKWLVLMGLLIITLIFTSVFFVWLQIERVEYGYQISKLQKEYEGLLTINRKLRLEWVRLHEPFYLEKLARKELGLAPPSQNQKILLTP